MHPFAQVRHVSSTDLKTQASPSPSTTTTINPQLKKPFLKKLSSSLSLTCGSHSIDDHDIKLFEHVVLERGKPSSAVGATTTLETPSLATKGGPAITTTTPRYTNTREPSTVAAQGNHFSLRRMSVDRATLENLLTRVQYNPERQVMCLNFENLRIESVGHLQNISSCIQSLLATPTPSGSGGTGWRKHISQFLTMNHMLGSTHKIDCYLNDDDLQCDSPEILTELGRVVHGNPLFRSVTRYTNKSLLQDHQKLIESSLRESEVFVKTHPCILDRYIVIIDENIGKGTYGTISAAYDLQTGGKVAVKRLCKKTMQMLGIEDFVQREIDIHHLIKKHPHPNIVQVLDVHENEDSILFVMEFLSGGSLENPLEENQAFPEQTAQRYFVEMVDALDHLHNRLHVLHRDLQMSNCCLDGEGHVKLVDFGLGCFFKENHRDHTLFCGNSQYACPELILKKAYGAEIDVYALGIILYKMLTGYMPFRGAQQKLLMQFSVPLDEDETLNDVTRDLLSHMLEVRTDKRYTLAKVKNHPYYVKGKQHVHK